MTLEERIAILETEIRAQDKALHVAYSELQRRLEILNHAHEEMVRDKAHYQSAEGFQMFFQDYGKWRDQVNNTLSNWQGRVAILVGGVGVAFALLQIAMKFWK